MRARPALASVTLAASPSLLASACGGDDGGSSASKPLCTGITQLDAIDSPGGPTAPTPDEVKAYGAQLSPALDRVRTGLKGRLGSDLALIDGAVASMSQGDASAADSPDVNTALDNVRKAAATDC
jgi:hypothetical protein